MDVDLAKNSAIAAHVQDALHHLREAEIELRHTISPNRSAIVREMVSASVSLGRVLVLVGVDE